jgi:hypothetical protein
MTGFRTLPSATRTPKAESRAGETHIETHMDSDTARGGEDLFLADRERLLLLVISVLVTLLLLMLLPQWQWQWLSFLRLHKAPGLDWAGEDSGARASMTRVHTSACALRHFQDHKGDQEDEDRCANFVATPSTGCRRCRCTGSISLRLKRLCWWW